MVTRHEPVQKPSRVMEARINLMQNIGKSRPSLPLFFSLSLFYLSILFIRSTWATEFQPTKYFLSAYTIKVNREWMLDIVLFFFFLLSLLPSLSLFFSFFHLIKVSFSSMRQFVVRLPPLDRSFKRSSSLSRPKTKRLATDVEGEGRMEKLLFFSNSRPTFRARRFTYPFIL